MSRETNERVEALLGGASKTHIGWRAACPFCADDGHRDQKTSLQILGDGRWWCYRCSTKGKLYEPPDPSFQARAVLQHVKDKSAPKPFDPPPFFVPLADDDSISLKPARDYLKSRKVSERLIRDLSIGACYDGMWAGRIIVPVHSDTDKLVWWGWIGRLWRNPAKGAQGLAAVKYLYPRGMERDRIVYNGTVLDDCTATPAMLVEGAFDTFPFPKDAFAVLGKVGAVQKFAVMERAKRPIAVVLDGDAWREGVALAMSFRFAGLQSGAVRLPPRIDPDEVPYEVLKDACRRCIKSPNPVRL